MNTFLSFAQTILAKAEQPLHYKEITERALSAGLKTKGSTPWATMNAQIIREINNNKQFSRFIKTDPGFYDLNKNYTDSKNLYHQVTKKVISFGKNGNTKTKEKEIIYRVNQSLNTKQKGDIAEARVAELITLYGDEGLSGYRPLSDDEGIDIIVKNRGGTEVAYIQVKSTFGDGSRGFVSSVKEKAIVNKRRMLMIFVYFDLTDGDIHEHVFCIPAPEFLRLTKNEDKKPGHRVFTVNLNSPDKSKYAEFLIEKRELANKILEILNET